MRQPMWMRHLYASTRLTERIGHKLYFLDRYDRRRVRLADRMPSLVLFSSDFLSDIDRFRQKGLLTFSDFFSFHSFLYMCA